MRQRSGSTWRGIPILSLPTLSVRLTESHPATDSYLMMGNDDWAVNMDELEQMEIRGKIKLLHGRVHPLREGYHLAGYGYVPLTIFSVKDWEKLDTYDQQITQSSYYVYVSTETGMKRINIQEWLHGRTTIREDLAELARESDPEKTIYVMHAPPYGTNLDKLYNGSSAGSRAIQEFIIEHQPCITLHGHIHE